MNPECNLKLMKLETDIDCHNVIRINIGMMSGLLKIINISIADENQMSSLDSECRIHLNMLSKIYCYILNSKDRRCYGSFDRYVSLVNRYTLEYQNLVNDQYSGSISIRIEYQILTLQLMIGILTQLVVDLKKSQGWLDWLLTFT